MARIKTYNLDSEINPADKIIGSDGKPGSTYGDTKNYSISNLASYFSGGEGAAGDSAYQVWLDNGNTGTEQDFLDSLVGAAGAQGPTGAAGAQGAAGADGTSITIQGTKNTVGDLPASGNVGDLWIIDTAGGGADAGDGYVWTDGGQWLNIGPLRGPQGVQGAQGAQGIQGIQGQQGIQGIQGTAGTNGTEWERVSSVTVKICDQNGNATGDYAALSYDNANVKMYKASIEGSSTDFMYYFSVDLTVTGNAAAKTFYDGNNSISLLFTGLPDDISNSIFAHQVFASLDFVASGTNKQVTSAQGSFVAADRIKITVSSIDLVTNRYQGLEGFSTEFIDGAQNALAIRVSGMFIAE